MKKTLTINLSGVVFNIDEDAYEILNEYLRKLEIQFSDEDGDEIMRTFGLTPCAEVGALKMSIKDAILDGIIPNEHDAAYEYMMKKAREMGLNRVESRDL